MADKSVYERAHPSRIEQSGGICFGTITQVYPGQRLCRVKTFGGTGSLNDQDILKCQWINLDANAQGDEATTIPRKNSMGIVFFIDGEPFIFGYFRALDGNKGAVAGNEYAGVEGDKIISTIGGNRIVVKRSGLVEVKSKETLKTIWFPTKSQLIHLCRQYELKADGGFQKWSVSGATNSTLWQAEYRQNPARFVVLTEEKGAVSGSVISRTAIGPAFPGKPGAALAVYEQTVGITGELNTRISPPGGIGGVSINVSPTGAMSIGTGIAPINQFGLSISPDGTTTIDINRLATFQLDKTGSCSLKNKLGEFSISATGQFALKGKVAEVLDLFDKTLEEFTNTLIALQQLTVGTGTGPSTMPLNLADFTKSMTNVIKIRTLLATLKG